MVCQGGKIAGFVSDYRHCEAVEVCYYDFAGVAAGDGHVVFQDFDNAVFGVDVVFAGELTLPGDVTCFGAGVYVCDFGLKDGFKEASDIRVEVFAGCQDGTWAKGREDTIEDFVGEGPYCRGDAYEGRVLELFEQLCSVFGVFG